MLSSRIHEELGDEIVFPKALIICISHASPNKGIYNIYSMHNEHKHCQPHPPDYLLLNGAACKRCCGRACDNGFTRDLTRKAGNFLNFNSVATFFYLLFYNSRY